MSIKEPVKFDQSMRDYLVIPTAGSSGVHSVAPYIVDGVVWIKFTVCVLFAFTEDYFNIYFTPKDKDGESVFTDNGETAAHLRCENNLVCWDNKIDMSDFKENLEKFVERIFFLRNGKEIAFSVMHHRM